MKLERIRRDLARDKGFKDRRSKCPKQFDAETGTERRERVLTYLHPELDDRTCLDILAALGVSNSTPLNFEDASERKPRRVHWALRSMRFVYPCREAGI